MTEIKLPTLQELKQGLGRTHTIQSVKKGNDEITFSVETVSRKSKQYIQLHGYIDHKNNASLGHFPLTNNGLLMVKECLENTPIESLTMAISL